MRWGDAGGPRCRAFGLPREDSSSARERSMGAVVRIGLISVASFFQRVFGTGGLRGSLLDESTCFFAARGVVFAQSGRSKGVY